MALVPHKITALAESDAQGTDGKNIVAGAVVSLYDTNGAAVTLFDDESGANGSTAKTTDATGQVVVYVTAGEYDEEVNGSVRRRVSVGGNSVISYATTSELQSSRPSKTGQRAENRERANAQYELAASGYTALPGDITAANGRVWGLKTSGTVLLTKFENLQQAEDRAQTDGFEILFPAENVNITSTVNKSNYTVWRGVGSNAAGAGKGSVVTSSVNGVVINITGTSTNQRGWIDGIRFINSSKTTYPNAVAISLDNTCRDHKIKDCYIGNYKDGVVIDGSKAIYLETVYVFGATNDGCRVVNGATDCWFIDSQFQGDNIGLNLDGSSAPLASMQVINSRPQVSGVWNMKAKDVSFLQIIGGYNDTAFNHSTSAGGGLLIEDCLTWNIAGTIFYSNGNNAPHIQISSASGNLCLNGNITGVQCKKSASNTGTVTGILFKDIAGTCRRVNISGCNLNDNDVSVDFDNITGSLDSVTFGSGNVMPLIQNESAIANTLISDVIQGVPDYISFSSPSSDIDVNPLTPKVVRISGAVASAIDLNLPSTGNYAGKSIKIIRTDGGAGAISVKDGGGTTRHTLSAANQWVELAAIGTGSTWVEIASDDLSR